MPLTRDEKYFGSRLIWKQNHSKLSKYMQPINMIMIYYRDKEFKKIANPGKKNLMSLD